MSNIIPLTPNLIPATIAEGEVTIARLSGLLETAFIDHDVDNEGDIYITDGVDFPLWVQIDGDRKFLVMFTFFPTEDEPAADWLARVNDMNAKISGPQFCYRRDAVWGCYRRDAVWGSYSITYDGGLNVRQFIKMLRIFGRAFLAGIELHKVERVDAPMRLA